MSAVIDLSPARCRPLVCGGVALATVAFWLICHLAELNLIGRDYYISLIEITHLNITSLNGTDIDLSVYFTELESSSLTSVFWLLECIVFEQ